MFQDMPKVNNNAGGGVPELIQLSGIQVARNTLTTIEGISEIKAVSFFTNQAETTFIGCGMIKADGGLVKSDIYNGAYGGIVTINGNQLQINWSNAVTWYCDIIGI